jgi:ketosteroid isomerase-like protein
MYESAALVFSLGVTGCAMTAVPLQATTAKEQVFAAERAFAKTMADRDHTAFAQYVSDEAVFFSGPTPLRGKQAVVDYWARFYSNPNAPFSWEPKEVEVLDSGGLAISSGPVKDANGKLIATFTSIWRLESTNTWRVVFDKGNPTCQCDTP